MISTYFYGNEAFAMFTADAHCDTLYEIAIKGTPAQNCCVTLERLKEGNVGLQTFAMFTSLRRPDPYGDALDMKEAYKRLPLPRLDGKLPDAPPQTPCAILSSEGGEAFRGDIEILRKIDDDVHLRLIALTWNFENEIGTPAKLNSTTGLKPFGFEFLKEMDRRGIAADVSHLNEAGFWDVIDHTRIAPLASHSDCRWLCDHPRNLTKDQVKALIERKGFIGVNFYSDFLAEGGTATLDDVLRHIDEICALGGEDIIGFGSDFDGIDVWPDGLGNPSDFPALLDLLKTHGYTDKQLEKIAGLNYWRFLKDAEKSAK